MKDMLNIKTKATREEVGAVISLDGYLFSSSWGHLWWFESVDARAAAIERLSVIDCICEPIGTGPDVVTVIAETIPEKAKRKRKAKGE